MGILLYIQPVRGGGKKRKRGGDGRRKRVAERLKDMFKTASGATFRQGRKGKDLRLIVGNLNIEGLPGDLTPVYTWLDSAGMN